MKHKLLIALGLIVLGWAVFAVVPAQATTAAGPYYANPSWDQTLPASTRFIVLSNMGGAAVLDRETGLVWEQSPSGRTFDWENAQYHCNTLYTGGRLGWRVPTLQELASLVDPTQSPTFPSGHPFKNVGSHYWSATTYAVNTDVAWFVGFAMVFVGYDIKSSGHFVWCVRGGQGINPQ